MITIINYDVNKLQLFYEMRMTNKCVQHCDLMKSSAFRVRRYVIENKPRSCLVIFPQRKKPNALLYFIWNIILENIDQASGFMFLFSFVSLEARFISDLFCVTL